MKKKQGSRSIYKYNRRFWTAQSLAQTLESRVLLSSAPLSASLTDLAETHFAQPLIQATNSGGSISPLATSPVGLSPAQMRGAYGLGQFGSSPITFGAAQGDGTGQTIAIIDAYDDPTALNDLNFFSTTFSLPTFNAGAGSPTFSKLNENGQTSPLPGTDPVGPAGMPSTWEEEESLDIEWAHAMAPNANLVLVECNSNSFFDLLAKGAVTAAGLPGVSVVSMSFGGSEFAGENGLDSLLTAPGVTFFASTGDKGSPGGYPAYSQNVVAVGGTSLTVSGNAYGSETGWNNSTGSSGGGISQVEFQPAFQTPYFTSSQRTIPDVSMDGDPNTGVGIYDTYDFPASPWQQFGGTSLASPMWAGLGAVVNQGRVSNSLSTLNGAGQTLPLLYGLPSTDFHDITSGSNGGFSAGPGYDLVTGRGSPMANLLIPALATATAPALLPDLQPVTPQGWSAPIMLETATGHVTDPTMISLNQELSVDAAWINNGAASESTPFNTEFFFQSADLGPIASPALNVGEAAEITDQDIGTSFVAGGIAELSYSIDYDPSNPNGDVAESTETNNTYTRTYVIDNLANDKYVLELNPGGTMVELFENNTLVYIKPTPSLNGMLFYLSGINDSLTVDATNGNPIPYGQLLANGAGSSNAITVNDPSGNNVVTDNASQLTLNGQVINYAGLGSITVTTGGGNDTLTQTAAPSASIFFNPGGGINTLTDNAGTVNLTTATSGIVSLTFDTVTISAGATVSMTKTTLPNRMVLQVSVLALSNSGLIDLNNNDMIVHAGILATITSDLKAGLNLASGYWNGSAGIRSSVAAGLHNTALGVELNNNGSSALVSTFDGQTVGITDVLVKYTYFGDANLDGTVSASDYIAIDNGLNSGGNSWVNGDFNYDGVVNGDDYSLIDNAYNTQGGVSLAAVPANKIATDTTAAAMPLAVHFSTVVITVAAGDEWSVSAPPAPLADDVLDAAGDDSVAR